MPRKNPEWIAKHDDQAVPPRVRLRIFEAHGGICHISKRKIYPGDAWDLDHIKPLCNGGHHRESNMAPALRDKHRQKTRDDVAVKSYHYRRRLANAGIKRKRRPMPGSRDSAWKVTFSRGVVRR